MSVQDQLDPASLKIDLGEEIRTDEIRPARPPPILSLFVVALLLVPEEASLFVGGLRMTFARLILLILTPYTLLRFAQHIGRSSYRFVWSDALFPLAGLWMVLSDSMTEGTDRAFVGAGVTALEFVGAYFAARVLLSERGQALALARLLSQVIAIVGLLSVLDALAGHYVSHDLVKTLTGYSPVYIYTERNGIVRAAGTLEHPIFLGVVCGFGMLLGSCLPMGQRLLVFGGTALGLLVSVSSGPFLATIIGFGCLFYAWLTRGFESRWRLLMLTAGAFLGALMIVLPAPFEWLSGHFTLDPLSGYYRLLIWQVAGADVLASPMFGIGLTEQWARPEWMPSSVDSVWLRSAMSFGIPGSILIGACIIGSCSRAVDTVNSSLSPDDRRLGLLLSLIQFLYVFLGFTVHFWGITWILMGFFAGMRAHLGALGGLPAGSKQEI